MIATYHRQQLAPIIGTVETQSVRGLSPSQLRQPKSVTFPLLKLSNCLTPYYWDFLATPGILKIMPCVLIGVITLPPYSQSKIMKSVIDSHLHPERFLNPLNNCAVMPSI